MYPEKELANFERAKVDWLNRSEKSRLQLLWRPWRNPETEKFAKYGLSRRIYQMDHYLNRVFEILPLNDPNPTQDSIFDATAFVQAFTINVYGSLDNLAQIWEYEKAKSGLPPRQIGLFARYKKFCNTLPKVIQDKLIEGRKWQEYLESFRDALVHRIPHYLPPKTLNPAEQKQWELAEATFYNMPPSERVGQYYQTMSALGRFQPWMVGSPNDKPLPMMLHPQMICDFATIVELTEIFLLHLDD